VIIDGICVPNVPVDAGAGVNIMLETTAFELGYSKFESTPTVLRMADQSKVLPIGQLSQVPTTIAGHTYLLNYVVIRVDVGNPFPVLLGRPWLYLADVKVDWKRQEFRIGKSEAVLSWQKDKYLGEMDTDGEGYTSEWTSDKERPSLHVPDQNLGYIIQSRL
jgi:hypothetical protein